MRFLLPILFLLLGLGGGIGAGLFLVPTSGGDAASTATDAEAADGHGDGFDHGADGASGPTGETVYVRLNNQFVVPIVRNGSVRSLVVIALTVEVSAGQNGVVFDREPRLRDAFLQAMFAHANSGGFNGSFTEAAAMAPLRSALNEAAQRVLGNVVHDVLIVDITRQDA